MAYRMTYAVSIDWIGPGQGQAVGGLGYGFPASGNAQTLTLFNQTGGQTIAGSGTGGAIATADITALGNAMNTDIQAQFKAAGPLAQMQGWISGQP